MMYPLVRELADDGIPVTVTCRVLKLVRQDYYRWLAAPLTARELQEAYLANALFDAHHDDPEFGYRFLADEVHDNGFEACERTIWKVCSANGWWSSFGKKKTRKGTAKVHTPAHDDLVRRQFSADAPNHLWLGDITEHQTREGKLYVCAIKDVFSNRIVGYSIDERMKARLAVAALNNAVARRGDVAGRVFTPTAARRVKSTGRRNTSILEVCECATGIKQKAIRLYRGQIPSPGRPSRGVARRPGQVLGRHRPRPEERRGRRGGRCLIPRRLSVVPPRWWREPLPSSDCVWPLLVLLRARGHRHLACQKLGVREIARQLERSPSTISRELRRNASTSAYPPVYKASTAQWHAERRARRPRWPSWPPTMSLRDYVQERLSGVQRST